VRTGAVVPTAPRRRVGAIAKALRYEWDSIQKVATGTPALALRVAPARWCGDGRWPVAVDPGLPALQTPAGCRRVGQGNETVPSTPFCSLLQQSYGKIVA
jgi:hypothetical protein